jgi:hypothetical protein
MRHCNNCQYENAEEARACARCGQPLSAAVAVAAGSSPSTEAPDWLRGIQLKATDDQAAPAPAMTGGAVAAAATLPVQIRRSRVPVLAVDARRLPVAPVLHTAAPPESPSQAEPTPEIPPATVGRPSRLLLVLILAVIIAAALYAAIRFLL